MLGLFVFLITSQNNNRQKIDTFTLMEVDILIVLGSKIRRNSKLIDQENVKITLKIKKKKIKMFTLGLSVDQYGTLALSSNQHSIPQTVINTCLFNCEFYNRFAISLIL